MSGEGALTLEDPRVQTSKTQFDKNRSRRQHKGHQKFSFEDYFHIFQTNALLEEIGQQAGVTRERVRKIYLKYFYPLFGERGWKLRHKAILENRFTAVNNDLTSDPLLQIIVERARNAGCVVEGVARKTENFKAKTSELLVNGNLCSLRIIKRVVKQKTSKRLYATTYIPMNTEVDACVIHIIIPSVCDTIFVIPRTVFQRYLSSDSRKKAFYVPLKQLPVYNNHTPLIDFWQYKDAWHLLIPKKE